MFYEMKKQIKDMDRGKQIWKTSQTMESNLQTEKGRKSEMYNMLLLVRVRESEFSASQT